MANMIYLDIKNSAEAQRIFDNFVRAVIAEHGEYYTWKQITDALVPYNAAYKYVPAKNSDYAKKHYLRFGSEAEMTAFVLRYS